MIPSLAAPLHLGRLSVRAATTARDLDAVLDLRARLFRGARGAADADRFDAMAIHALIEDSATGALRGGFRLLPLRDGADLSRGYAAESYDLSALAAITAPVLELGRFAIDPEGGTDPDALRLAWAFITREVDARGAAMLCGCTSFRGRDPALHRAALTRLCDHLAPPDRAPRPRGPWTVPFAAELAGQVADPREALAGMPTLLRTYLTMGGWVSDHAVPDADLDTLHVFTAVEIAAIPPARARLLRALAG